LVWAALVVDLALFPFFHQQVAADAVIGRGLGGSGFTNAILTALATVTVAVFLALLQTIDNAVAARRRHAVAGDADLSRHTIKQTLAVLSPLDQVVAANRRLGVSRNALAIGADLVRGTVRAGLTLLGAGNQGVATDFTADDVLVLAVITAVVDTRVNSARLEVLTVLVILALRPDTIAGQTNLVLTAPDVSSAIRTILAKIDHAIAANTGLQAEALTALTLFRSIAVDV
jgi:hypothetical protein